MKKSIRLFALASLSASALLSVACGGSGKDTTQPPDTTVTPPPPPPGPNPPPPPPPTGSATVFAAGNIGKCPVNGGAEATARLVDSTAAAVFVLGNAANPNGSAANYSCGFDPFWGRFKAKTYATMGNHDVLDTLPDGTRNAADFYAYFGDRAGPAGKGWYSFDLNGWHVVVLNTEGGTATYNSGSAQQAWLAADLNASTAKCKMAVFHRSFVYTGSAGPSMNSNLASIWSKLAAGGVDVVLTAGAYTYERMNPVASNGQPDAANGIVQFNVGMGGETSVPGSLGAHHPASAYLTGDSGVLRLTLNGTGFDWNYLKVDGSAGDTGSATCR